MQKDEFLEGLPTEWGAADFDGIFEPGPMKTIKLGKVVTHTLVDEDGAVIFRASYVLQKTTEEAVRKIQALIRYLKKHEMHKSHK